MNMGDGHQSEAQSWIQKALRKMTETARGFSWEETTPFMRNGSNETAIMSMPGKTWERLWKS